MSIIKCSDLSPVLILHSRFISECKFRLYAYLFENVVTFETFYRFILRVNDFIVIYMSHLRILEDIQHAENYTFHN